MKSGATVLVFEVRSVLTDRLLAQIIEVMEMKGKAGTKKQIKFHCDRSEQRM